MKGDRSHPNFAQKSGGSNGESNNHESESYYTSLVERLNYPRLKAEGLKLPLEVALAAQAA